MRKGIEMNRSTRPLSNRGAPRRSVVRRPSKRTRLRVRRWRGASRWWLLVILLLVIGGELLWRQEPALHQMVVRGLALVQYVGWWLGGGLVLLGVGLASGVRWCVRWLSQVGRSRFRARQAHLRALQDMDPLAFEQQVGRLFESAGYRVAYTAQSGDEGIDLWLEKTPRTGRSTLKSLVGGSVARRIPVQCKRYGPLHAVGSPDLQRFSGAMRRAKVETGIFVTTSRFTPAARAWSKKEGIQLIDGAALARWQTRWLPAESAMAGKRKGGTDD